MTPIPIVTRLLLGLSLAATIVLGSPNTASAHIGEGPEAGPQIDSRLLQQFELGSALAHARRWAGRRSLQLVLGLGSRRQRVQPSPTWPLRWLMPIAIGQRCL